MNELMTQAKEKFREPQILISGMMLQKDSSVFFFGFLQLKMKFLGSKLSGYVSRAVHPSVSYRNGRVQCVILRGCHGFIGSNGSDGFDGESRTAWCSG